MTAGPAAADTEVRDALREIWAAVLLTDEPGDDANFYEDGGDSLLALTFSRAVTDRLGVAVPPLLLLTVESFGELVAAVRDAPGTAADR